MQQPLTLWGQSLLGADLSSASRMQPSNSSSSQGFGKLADRSATNRLPTQSLVGKGGNKDDRDTAALIHQNPLQREPIQALHSDIENQT